MATTENLLYMTQNLMTPDIVQKISGELGEPTDKIQNGLRAVLPTFLMGVANKGSSPSGAETLVGLARKQETSAPSYSDGSETVSGIFGSNLNAVAASLETTTGMSTSVVKKMMGMLAPLVMGIIGKKIHQEGMSANGLMGFLGQQKSMLANFLPLGLTSMFGVSTATKIPNYEGRKTPWFAFGILALLILGGLWWFTGNRITKIIEGTSTSTITEAINVESTGLVAPAANLTGLAAFIQGGNTSELPKRFSFENLTFDTGTTSLREGAEAELDEIATLLGEYPNVSARIEGFTDNTGDFNNNLSLSQARAEVVKNELVSRGVEAGRLDVAGRGSEAPVSSNENEDGRAKNRRIEFVVTGK